jgi:hypothetical protein
MTTRRRKAKPKPKAERTQIRLYPADLMRLNQLVAVGYGANRSAVIRRLALEMTAWRGLR